MRKKHKIRRAAGFTIAELVVSFFIIALMAGIFLTNYKSSQKRTELVIAAQKMVSDIRLAQNYSLGLAEFDADHSGQIDSGETVPAGGWGMYFNIASPDNYIIFADTNDPQGNRNYDGAGELDEIINISDNITIDSISDDSGSLSNAAITFFPPNPVTYINGVANNTVQIVLKDNSSTAGITVEVNFFGLVDVID